MEAPNGYVSQQTSDQFWEPPAGGFSFVKLFIALWMRVVAWGGL